MFSQLPDIEGGTKRRGNFTSDVSIDGSANEGLAMHIERYIQYSHILMHSVLFCYLYKCRSKQWSEKT